MEYVLTKQRSLLILWKTFTLIQTDNIYSNPVSKEATQTDNPDAFTDIRYSTTMETTKADQAESSEKNDVIVTIVAIIIVTAAISICVFFYRNKDSKNNSKMKDIKMEQEEQPRAQGKVQNSAGLVYIEVDFEPIQNKNGKKLFSIHSSNNRTPYADIDLMSTADPLPESESDDNVSEEDDFFTLEDVQVCPIEILK